MQLDVASVPHRSAWHRARAGLHVLVVSDVRPERLGAAVGLGVLFGCTPFFGAQFMLALLVAVPLRLNKLAVLLGTQISIPPLAPFIVFAGANLGELILHRRLLPLTLGEIRATPVAQLAERFLIAWTVGGVALGLLLGAIIGAAVAIGARRYRSYHAGSAEI